MSAFWICYETIICLLMGAAIALQFYYIFSLAPNVPVQSRWEVYDSGMDAVVGDKMEAMAE